MDNRTLAASRHRLDTDLIPIWGLTKDVFRSRGGRQPAPRVDQYEARPGVGETRRTEAGISLYQYRRAAALQRRFVAAPAGYGDDIQSRSEGLRRRAAGHAGIHRGVPAVLKNAFDWGTRPPGHNVWAGKPGAIGGAIGTAVAQSQLRNTLVVLEVILMGQPELYFQFKPGIISEAYDITDEKARAFLSSWVNKFELWIRRIASDA
jgi:hypothetical protein